MDHNALIPVKVWKPYSDTNDPCGTLAPDTDVAGKKIIFVALDYSSQIIYYSLLKLLVMIIVHDIFICKPGNASKVAKMFKEAMVDNADLVNIMTDLTGQYNRVVMVTKHDNLSAYEKSFEKYMQDNEEIKKMKERMQGYHDMYLSGSRDIFQVW